MRKQIAARLTEHGSQEQFSIQAWRGARRSETLRRIAQQMANGYPIVSDSAMRPSSLKVTG
jgi:hypothetical protein